MADSNPLQFVPFTSAIDASFWYQLSDRKINVYKLEDKPINICSFYANNNAINMPAVSHFDYTAFNGNLEVPPMSFPLQGLLYNTNTLDDFKNRDKKELLQDSAKEIWESMISGQALQDPSVLQKMICLTFADLKKYVFYYWVAFPALQYPRLLSSERTTLGEYFNQEQMTQLMNGYDAIPTNQKMGFLVHLAEDHMVTVSYLKDYETLCEKPGKVLLAFADPSSLPAHPGWPLRNILSLAALKWGSKVQNWDVICFRQLFKDGKRSCDHSLVVSVKLSEADVPKECPTATGWEKNEGKLIPHVVNMTKSMDPASLAESSADLNLRLMKWRIVPDLNLDILKSTRCLLFGAGTLGCNVARCLLGWGVRKITFVDYSRVSYSNPVRQTLFQFDDCQNGGKPKATAAADALKRIFPGVDCEGRLLSVPMPGHSLTQNTIEETRATVEELDALVESHDVLFLLMDTRESRWLPSVLGRAKQKIVINAALGFDTFLVMRHGVRSPSSGDADGSDLLWKEVSGSNLGCYFCSDVVAPGNSSVDRTLDQQCTVTRPGMSYVGAALAVELMANILQHPQKGAAPAAIEYEQASEAAITPLGLIPHQVRGYMDRFQNMVHICKKFEHCVACSEKVVQSYEKDGFDFLLKVFNDPHYLNELTGLSDLLKKVNIEDVLVLSDDESP